MTDSISPAFAKGGSRATWVWCSRATWILLAGFAALLFFHLEHASLWYADEYRGAERAREFLVTGNPWVVQENFQPNFHKPPLHYWLTASTLRPLGEGKFAMRFWTWVFTVGTLGLAAVYARRLLPEFPLAPALVLAAVALYGPFVEYVQIGLLDAGLMFWTLAVLVCAEFSRGDRRWSLAAGVCAGLGSLYKVPLPLGAWMVWLLLRLRDPERGRGAAGSSWLWAGLVAAVGLTSLWPVIQMVQHGEEWWKIYIQSEGGFLLKQSKKGNLGLVTYAVWLISKWYLLGVVSLAGAGWVWWKGWSARSGEALAVRLYEAAVIASVYLMAASLMQAKSQRYVLPVLPLLAVVGVAFFLRWPMPSKWRAACIAAGVLPLLAAFWPHYYKRERFDFSTRIAAARRFGANDPGSEFVFIIDEIEQPAFLLFFARLRQPVYSLPRELAIQIDGTWHGLISSCDWPALESDAPGARKLSDDGQVVEFVRDRIVPREPR